MIVVSGAFDDLRSPQARILDQASRLGDLTALLWSDAAVERLTGRPPKFPERERRYILEALRFVSRVLVVDPENESRVPLPEGLSPDLWVAPEEEHTPALRAFCAEHRIGYRKLDSADLAGFPTPPDLGSTPGRKKVIVTGCYDWLHSGHIRFFEEVSQLGVLYVSLGSDVTIRDLKGAGHPLIPQQERMYMVRAVRYVHHAFIASGSGYLDAAPEIERLRPEIYAVNEDGDRPDKRAFCAERGIEYVVLKRLPKDGLPARQSTELRGF